MIDAAAVGAATLPMADGFASTAGMLVMTPVGSEVTNAGGEDLVDDGLGATDVGSTAATTQSAILSSATFTAAVTPSTIFNGVAAGDMTSNDAILWTRATDGTGTGPVSLTAQVSTDASFASGVLTFTGTTSAASDFTLKLDAIGLAANTTYFYRFVDGSATASAVGRFMTAAAANQKTEVKFGFSGDADGRFRPYTMVSGFGTASQPQSQNLQFFTFLGDTMYETASTGSAAVPAVTSATTGAALTTALAAYDRKYLENVSGVNSASGAVSNTGQQGLQNMQAATGEYTLLDNHELGNASLQSGGAPLAAGSRVTSGQGFDVNTTGTFDNQTAAFKTLEKAFFDYHPMRDSLDATLTSTGPTVSAPTDARSNGTVQQYFSQQQGANAVYIQLDDRSYRDARLGTPSNADDVTSGRQLNVNRTMLGSTQLAWFKQSLLAAQAAGTPWKFVAISTPIDATGPAQDGKSWFGGYTAERNDLLKFIADNHIQNVVFLTTDDHLTRMNALQYQTTFGDASTTTTVPGAFQVVTGPIGAGGPDAITDHSFSNLTTLLNTTNSGLQTASEPMIGLSGFTGLSNTHRQLDPNSGTVTSSIDFYSPDTFNYTVLDVSADGSSLTVDTYGIPSYQQNTFPQDTPAVTDIMGFTISAGFVANAPAPCFAGGTMIATAAGEVAVEDLKAGDPVLSAFGGAVPVRWLGHRRVDCAAHSKPADVMPVRVTRGAFAQGLPTRDLLLSPDHALYVREAEDAAGVLIPVRYLVNGRTIVQEQVATVTYYHVELPAHDVLFAEGLPAESYLDTGNRAAFANGGAVMMAQPDFALGVWEAAACAPLVVDGPTLVAARLRLLARAVVLGHARTTDAGTHLVVDGRRVDPAIDGDVHRFELPEGACDISLVSRTTIPAETLTDQRDHRRLGVAVSRMVVDGVAVGAADPRRTGTGWYPAEAEWQWTDGRAVLLSPGARRIEVTIRPVLSYWDQNAPWQAAAA